MGGAIPPPVAPAAPTATTGPAATPAAPVAEATVAKLPDRLQDISRPVVLTGTVAGETPEGFDSNPHRRWRGAARQPHPAAGGQAGDAANHAGVNRIRPGPNGQADRPRPAAKPCDANRRRIGGRNAVAVRRRPQTPSVILPTPTATPMVPTLPLLTVGTVVPALVLAAATSSRPPTASGAAAPNQPTIPGTTVAAPPSGSTPAASGGAAGGTAAPPSGAGAAPSAAMPLPSAPMPDASVELGGDAAHPGAETPTLKPPPSDSRRRPRTCRAGRRSP